VLARLLVIGLIGLLLLGCAREPVVYYPTPSTYKNPQARFEFLLRTASLFAPIKVEVKKHFAILTHDHPSYLGTVTIGFTEVAKIELFRVRTSSTFFLTRLYMTRLSPRSGRPIYEYWTRSKSKAQALANVVLQLKQHAQRRPSQKRKLLTALENAARLCYRTRDYRCALMNFKKALSLSRAPKLHFNVASANDKLGHHAAARAWVSALSTGV
jgi:hypothetical protein